MSWRLGWERDGTSWPNRSASRSVKAAGLRFHVQVLGEAKGHRDVALLLHGTGASSHSFADLAPHLARHVKVIVPDLPGHGFSEVPAYSDLALPAMAASLAGLLHELRVQPKLVVGHSTGAAILARMVLDGLIAPKLLVSLDAQILMVTGGNERMIAPSQSLRLRRILPNARLELLSDLGHLAHEEAPELVGNLILDAWRKAKDA